MYSVVDIAVALADLDDARRPSDLDLPGYRLHPQRSRRQQHELAIDTVLTESEQDRLGVIHRVGLRYVDVVRPRAGKSFRFYLRPGLHGVPDEVFQPGGHLLHIESRGRTVVGGHPGAMVVRIVQNNQGLSLPPDLMAAAPSLSPRAEAGGLVTLIDMDHYVEGKRSLSSTSCARRRSTKRPLRTPSEGRRRWAMPWTPSAKSVKPGCRRPASRRRRAGSKRSEGEQGLGRCSATLDCWTQYRRPRASRPGGNINCFTE